MADGRQYGDSHSKPQGPDDSHLRVPPSDYACEQAVLGACLLDATAYNKIATLVTAESFYWEKHGLIYKLIADLHRRGEPTDLLTLSAELKVAGKLDDVGGDLYLTQLSESIPFPRNVDYYAKIVKAKHQLREVSALAADMGSRVFDPAADPDELLGWSMGEVLRLMLAGVVHSQTIGEVLMDTIDRFERILSGEESAGIPWPWPEVNAAVGPMRKGKMTAFTAETSLGKSAFVGDLCRRLAKQEFHVGIGSQEMLREELAERWLSAEVYEAEKVDLPYMAMNTGGRRLRDNIQAVGRAASALAVYSDRWHVLRTVGLRPAMIRAEFSRMRATAPEADWLFVLDYHQILMPPEGRFGTAEERLAAISDEVVSMAEALEAHIILVGQMNKAQEYRDNGKPTTDSWRGSNKPVHDSNSFLALLGERNSMDRTLYVVKNRGGLVGAEIPMSFLAPYGMFVTDGLLAGGRPDVYYDEQGTPEHVGAGEPF